MHNVTRVKPRSPCLALVLSLFCPGLGSFYGGQPGMGVFLIVAMLISLAATTVIVGFFLVPVVWVFAMWHAFHAVKDWNAARGIES